MRSLGESFVGALIGVRGSNDPVGEADIMQLRAIFLAASTDPLQFSITGLAIGARMPRHSTNIGYGEGDAQ